MRSFTIDLEEDLAALLCQGNQALGQTAREMIVLELYRRGTLSSGKAAQLLGTTRWAFVHHAAELGIPFFSMSEDEWEAERAASERV